MENANTKCTDINSLAEKNQRLVEQVDLISVSNSSQVIKELNDTVLSLSIKIDNLSTKTDNSHKNIISDIAHI